MNYKHENENNRRRMSRHDRELRGDDTYYGGARSQREDWGSRSFDNNDFDRREGMYQAGGRDFDERIRDTYGFPSERRPGFTGGDRGWSDRQEERSRHGFMEEVKNFFGIGPKGYKRTDERIREDVCEALARHPDVDASEIEVYVKDGCVILTGTVENRLMKRKAEDAMAYLPGVEDVRVELTIPRNTDSTGEINPRLSLKPTGDIRKAQ